MSRRPELSLVIRVEELATPLLLKLNAISPLHALGRLHSDRALIVKSHIQFPALIIEARIIG